MDKTILVKSDVEIWGLILDALTRIKLPVSACGWRHVPELDESHLVIATPWYDSKGPRETYRAVIDAFESAGIYQNVPMRRVFVVSPTDPAVQDIDREGFLHLIRHESRDDKHATYSLIFAPITGAGGAVPSRSFAELRVLRSFLADRLRLGQGSVQDAVSEMDAKGSSSIFPVYLTSREIKKLGLG